MSFDKDKLKKQKSPTAEALEIMLTPVFAQTESTTLEDSETVVNTNTPSEEHTMIQHQSTAPINNSEVIHESKTPKMYIDVVPTDSTHVVYTQKSGFKKEKKLGIRETHYPTTYQVVNELKAWIQDESASLGREGSGFVQAFVNTALYNAYQQYMRGELELSADYAKVIREHFNTTSE